MQRFRVAVEISVEANDDAEAKMFVQAGIDVLVAPDGDLLEYSLLVAEAIDFARIVAVRELPPVEWTDADQVRADAEGWGMFNGADVQADDSRGIFTSDPSLWLHLRGRALAGDEFAARALAWVEQENAKHYAEIMSYA